MRTPVAVALATAAYVLGWTAHVTFIFYLAPVALRQAGLHDADAWVFSGTAIASILTALPAGRLADAWPRRRVLRLGLLLLALSYAPLLVPPTFAGVLVATAITGTGLALLLVSFTAYLADLLAARGMSQAFGRTTALAILAGAIGPFLAAALFGALADDALALRISAGAFALGAAIGVGITLALPTVRAPAATETATGGSRAVAPVALIYLLTGVGSGIASPYFAVYFLDVVRTGEATWGVLLGIATAASALGAVLVGRLGRAVTHARLLIAPQAMLLGVSLAFLWPLSVPILGIAYAARSLFAFTVSPTLNALLMGRVEPRARGRANAWTNFTWNIGWATGAGVGGILLGQLGGGAFVVGGALNLLGVGLGVAWLAHAPEPRAAA